jgi:hypothetical protein
MKKSDRILFCAAVSMLSLAACDQAPTPAEREARLKEVSASAIPGATPADIVISEESAGAAKVTWKAEAQGKTYACDADELLRLPSCKEAG